jgi:hypothetical protein
MEVIVFLAQLLLLVAVKVVLLVVEVMVVLAVVGMLEIREEQETLLTHLHHKGMVAAQEAHFLQFIHLAAAAVLLLLVEQGIVLLALLVMAVQVQPHQFLVVP